MTTATTHKIGDLELNNINSQKAPAEQPFDWLKQWYPISPLSHLDVSRPTPITLLGKKLVVWQSGGQWAVMDDVCPHKLTQLSLGKIHKNGTLACRHHGWEFDCSGQCVKIPMLVDSDTQTAVYHNDRAHVNTYLTQVLQGLLWVWLDASATAKEESQLKQPAILSDPDEQWMQAEWQLADVPVGYTVSLESSFDPSHAQFLHEGIFGFSPNTAIPMDEFELIGEMSAEDGFALKHGGYNFFNQGMKATRTFHPPCANITQYHMPTGLIQTFQLYFVPTAPGHCRYISKFVVGTPPSSQFKLVQWFNRRLVGLLPRDLQIGLQHLQNYRLSDQDITAMRAQEQNEAAADPNLRPKPFFPSPADQGVLSLRTWLKRYAGGGPTSNSPYAEGRGMTSDERLYDRWHRHTKICPNCRHSVEWLAKVQRLCQRLAIVAAVLGAMLFLLPFFPPKVSLGCLIVSILSMLGHQGLTQLQHRFISSIPLQGKPKVTLYTD